LSLKKIALTNDLRVIFGVGGVAVLLLALTAAVSFSNIRTLYVNAAHVSHSRAVLRQLERVLSTVKDAETGQRGYLLTGRDPYLEPYREAVGRLPAEMAELRQLTTDNAAQQARIATFEAQVAAKMAELESTIATYREQGPAAAIEIVATGQGRQQMLALRNSIAEMEHAENFLLAERSEESSTSLRHTLAILIGSLVATLLLLISTAALLRSYLTHRRKIDEALRAEREWLHVTLRSIGDAVLATDIDGEVLLLNPVAEALTGFSTADAQGKRVEEVFRIINEHTREPAEIPVHRVLREGVVVGLANHTILISRSGVEHPIDDSAAPIRDADGKMRGVVLVFRDVAERRRAEESLRFLAGAGTTLGALVDYRSTLQKVARLSVPFFSDFCVVDVFEQSGIRGAATAHVDPLQDSHLRKMHERWPLDWQAANQFGDSVRNGKPHVISSLSDEQLRAMARDEEHHAALGQLAPCSLVAVPLLIRGKVHGALLFGQAVSGRRFNDDDLELAQELARRTAAALENVRLYEELRDADRRKDEFLAMLAHELRNPLAAIQYAHQLASTPGSVSDDIDCLRIIGQQVQQLKRILDDLLDVSRITRDKIVLKQEVIDAAPVIERAVAVVKPLIEQRHHRLSVDTGKESLLVVADAARLEQMIVNLLTNAAKYTEDGGEIALSARCEEGRIIVAIRDSGVGLSADMLSKVFGLFVQVDPSLDRTQGGLGIGLTLVRKLAELHAGGVMAESDGVGRGSTFTLWLPAAKVCEHDASAAPTASSPSRPLRILVVEDNVDTANLIATLLKNLKHDVRICYDGRPALSEAIAYHPQVVLLDLGLPGMDGFQLALAMRSEPSLAGVHLIAISGYGQEEDRKRSHEVGFHHHLLKPVEFPHLTQILTDIGRQIAAQQGPSGT